MPDHGRKFHCTEDARLLARRRMPRIMFDFVDGAAGGEGGARLNRAAIEAIRLRPRVLRNVAERNLGTAFLGATMGRPFGIAPMGMCDLTWPGADRMLAAEAVRAEVPLCLSSAASTSMEEMARLSAGRAWFQLYVGHSHEAAFGFVDRAAAAGYEVLVLTVDVPQVARRVRDQRNGFQVPFKIGPKQALDFALHPRWSIGTLLKGPPKPMNYETDGTGRKFVRGESRAGTDWAFLDCLRERWTGKLVVKGVLTPEDAVAIKAAGADAVYVSNHGGRQLDGAPAAIEALASIRAAVGDDYPVIFDSGLRSGEDIVKALAVGADFVMLGRSLLYAIGADGAQGLASLMDFLTEDISVTLAQLGLTAVDAVGRDALWHPTTAE